MAHVTLLLRKLRKGTEQDSAVLFLAIEATTTSVIVPRLHFSAKLLEYTPRLEAFISERSTHEKVLLHCFVNAAKSK